MRTPGAINRTSCTRKGLSDRQLLQRLLDSGRLSENELHKARGLYVGLIAYQIERLEAPLRAWADHLYFEYSLGGHRPDEIALARKTRRSKLVDAFDAKPRAKRPGTRPER